MGIPGLARKIIKNNNAHLWDNKMIIHYLFFDFNPIIYDCVRDLESTKSWNFSKKNVIEQFEKELIDYIIDKTKHIVNDIIKPEKLVYIAIDGSPPYAKMKQQRLRRFKPKYMEKFYKQYYPNEYVKNIKWDTSQISPGTIFMYNLNEKFKKEISNNCFGDINVVFNGSDIPGEAEHKFLSLIDKINIDKNENYCVYSADGDQIIILLQYTNRNMYILRSLNSLSSIEDKYPDDQEYVLLDINYISKKFESEGILENDSFNRKSYYKKGGKNKDFDLNYIYDIMFLSFLEGNDFAMPIFFLKFKDDHMKTLLNYYKIIKNDLNQSLIISKNNKLIVNHKFILNIFENIKKIEDNKINLKNIIVQKLINQYTKNPKNVNKCEITFENVEHKLFYCPNHPLYKDFMKEWQKIYKNGIFDKNAYYKYFLGDKMSIDDLCKDYVKILIFNLNYYFGKEIFWRYQYSTPIAPLPSDFYEYLSKNPKIFETVKFEKGGPYDPYVQLSYILPPESQKSIPSIFKKTYSNKNSNMYKNYNEELSIELVNSEKLIYAEIEIPNISINKLEEYYKKVKSKMTEKEKLIGKLSIEPLIFLPNANNKKLKELQKK